MTLTYLDSGVLIALAQGNEDRHTAARLLVADAARSFASSDMIWLETVPQAPFRGGGPVAAIYEAYFSRRVAVYISINADLVREARRLAAQTGVAGADAINAAAALRSGAAEFITTEKATKPLFRLTGIKVFRL